MFPYIGGKSSHIKWLDPLFPKDSKTFVEVFGGAGWVGVKSKSILSAKTRIYNDFNPFIANIHECFRTKQTELLQQLEDYPKSDRTLYLKFQQDIFGPNAPQSIKMPDVELAAKYLYLQTQIFSGVTLSVNSPVYFCDVASNGKYASKYDAVKNKLKNPRFTDRLSEVSVVENMDCIDLIKKYDSPDSFFYVDPPYFKKEYLYTHDFPREKHEELADTLKNCKGRWLLSYYDFPELSEWYPTDQYKWHSEDVFRWSSTRAHKDPNYKTNSRGVEIAIYNYELSEEPSRVFTPVSDLFEF